MKSDTSPQYAHAHIMIGQAKVADVVAPTFFTLLVFGFYMAHYTWSTGFFTPAFTPLLAALFFASVLYVIINANAKALTPRKDVQAIVELIGAVLFVIVAYWFFTVFPLNFAHVADVILAPFQFLLSWLTNDIGRIIVAVVLLAAVIALAVDSVRLVWRVTAGQFRNTFDASLGP